MMRTLCIALAAVLAGLVPAAGAQLLDDIETRTDQGATEIRLQFSVPVRYVRHFPEARGELVKLYLQALTLDGVEENELREYKGVPVSKSVPPFTVVYSTVRSCLAVPDPICLDIQFRQPVRFDVRPGKDGRSIVLVVLPDDNPGQGVPATNRR